MTASLAAISKECPITGLLITQKAEFTDVKLDANYHCSIQLIGKRIINIALCGKITPKGTRRLVRLHADFLQTMELTDKLYVEIRDCAGLTGLPPEKSRSQLAKFIQTQSGTGHLAGFWLYRLPKGLKSAYHTGLKLIDPNLRVGVLDSYKEAITQVIATLRDHNIDIDLFDTSHHRFTKDDWVLEKEGYKVIFEIIGDNIVYSEPHGVLKQAYVNDVFSLYHKVIQEAGLVNGKRHYRILNWKHFKKNQWQARKDYVRHVREINKLYPSALSVICGMNPFMRLMLSLSKPFIPFEVASARDLDQALEVIENERQYIFQKEHENLKEKYDQNFNLQVEKYKNQLLKFMGSLEWDQKGLKNEQISDDHPFKEIFDAISIIKNDLDTLFEARNKVESRLKQSQEKYRNILENIDDGYYEVDLEGNFLFFNETLLKLLGYTKAEFSSMNYRHIIDNATAREVFQAFESVYITEMPRSDFGYELISKNGKRLYGETSISLMRDVKGGISGFRGVVRDRTEKKALETELITHRDSLEKMITLRTRELEEETIQKNHIKKINSSIFNISNAVNATQSLEELYVLIHQYLNGIIAIPNFYIGIYDRKNDVIDVPYHADQYDSKISQIPEISKKNSLSSQVVLNRAPLFLLEQELRDRSKNKKLIGHVPKSWMGVPLVSQGRTIGIMAAQSYTDPNHFDDKDLEVLISVSNQVALAIERRQALDDLHEREEKYRKLIETTSAGYWQVDENDRTVDVNQALCDMIGYSREQIIDKPPFDFFEDQSKGNYKNILLKSHVSSDRSYEVTFVTKKGEHLYAKVDATSMFDENKTFKGSFAFITDITNRIHAQQALHKAKERLEEAGQTTRTIIENLQAGVVLINADTHIIEMVNPAAAAMFGSESEEIVGNLCHNFLCPNQEGQCPVTDLKTSVMNLEKQMLNVHNQKIPILKTVNTISLNQKQYLLESFVDITEQKKAEKRLINETARANAMAEAAQAASTAKSQFLANISHEVRTPLNGVIGMAELLMESSLKEDQEPFVRTIGSEADSLLQIINTLLDFSKIEAGKMELEEIDFNLRKLFEELSDMMDIRAMKKGLDFFAFLDTKIPPRLKGDPGRLRQILMNLVGNALKFTHKGEILLAGNRVQVSNDTVTIKFEVRDTGIGIPENKLEHIFQSFSQADGSTTRKYGGTGLGTTIAKQLTQLMNGSIGVESRVNHGSTFWFEIPFKKNSEKSTTVELAQTPISGSYVLVVATRKTDRFIIEKYLKSFECTTVMADSVKQGLQIIKTSEKREQINLILANFDRSTTDGFNFASAIRQTEAGADIPIILMTAMGVAGDARRCRQIGINGYLHKPVKKDELRMAIASTLGISGAGKENKTPQVVTKHSIKDSLRNSYQILVAEDYPTNQLIAQKHLTTAGFNVVIVENGAKAISQFKKAQFDLILMDIQMPEIDGYEATRQIRQIEAYISKGPKKPQRTPIIAMTAHTMKGYKEKCLAADMDDYLGKPLKKSLLISTVEKWVKNRTEILEETVNATMTEPQKNPLPIDMPRALEEFENDEDFLTEILDEFIKNVDTQLAMIRSAVKTGDFNVIEKQGHAIKGGAANLTALDLSRAAFEVEKAGKKQDLDHCRKSINQMASAFACLCEFLDSIKA